MVNWEIKRDKNGFIDMESFLSRQDAVQYEAGVLIPGVWKVQAATLLHAADKLFQVYDAAETREEVRDLAAIEYTKQTGNNYQMDSKERVDWSNDYNDRRLLQVFFLLVGYAIENLIKGILYGKHPNMLKESDGNQRLALTCHNLSELYRIAMDLEKLTEIEPGAREILDCLTQYILWRGRYAIPLDLKQFSSLPGKTPLCLNYSDRANLNIGPLRLLIEQLVNELDNVPVPPTHLDGRK